MMSITMRVSAVCRVRDGYTGRIVQPSSLLCALDGQSCTPVCKAEGYLVLINLTPGLHRLSLRAAGYQEEWVELEIGDKALEVDVTMKPGANYPLQQLVTRLHLRVLEKKAPAADRQIWLAAPGAAELKIAQTKAEAGSNSFRLYCKGTAALLPMPGSYLIADGKNSEVVTLQSLAEELGTLAAPLAKSHARSCVLLPAQRYHTDGAGLVQAVFRQSCTVEVYAPERGLLGSLELQEGENEQSVSL